MVFVIGASSAVSTKNVNLEKQFAELDREASEDRLKYDFWRPTKTEARAEEQRRIALFRELSKKAKDKR